MLKDDYYGWCYCFVVFDLNQNKVLNVREPCSLVVLDVTEPYLFSFGSWCYWTLSLYYGSWCYRTMDVLGSDVIEPMIAGSDVIEPLCWFRC